jgi:hypothetical protein
VSGAPLSERASDLAGRPVDRAGQVPEGFFDTQGRVHLCCLEIPAIEFLHAELVGLAARTGLVGVEAHVTSAFLAL